MAESNRRYRPGESHIPPGSLAEDQRTVFPSGRAMEFRPQSMHEPRALGAPEFIPASAGLAANLVPVIPPAATARDIAAGIPADTAPAAAAPHGSLVRGRGQVHPPARRQHTDYHFRPAPATDTHHTHRGRGTGRRDSRGRGGAGNVSFRAAKTGPPDLYASNRMRDDARKNLSRRQAVSHSVPQKVNAYYRLNPIETAHTGPGPGKATLYKAISSIDGEAYALRRFVGYSQSPSDQIIRSVEAWKKARHPGVVGLREAFTSRAFSPNESISEVVFVYEFFPQAETLAEVFFPDSGASGIGPLHPIPEHTLWAFTIQLLNIVYAVHSAGLSLRGSLSPTGILLTGRNRLRANKCGVADAFDTEGAVIASDEESSPTAERLTSFQQQDLASVAKIVLALAARPVPGLVRAGHLVSGVNAALDYVRQSVSYSAEIAQLAVFLVSATGPRSQTTIRDVLALVAPRMSVECSNVWVHSDAMEAQVYAEMDSSRMLRLITLLGFVNERDGGNLEANWSETGDNYLLKLFRDYVFHQNDTEGRPVLDYSHILQNLSRLDAGSEEQLLLSSRDGGALLVASYADMKRCLYNAIEDLRRRGTARQ